MDKTKKLISQIELWHKGTDKLVVGIDGYSGSGKTTLSDQLASRHPGILVAHRDDFAIDRTLFTNQFATCATEAEKITLLRKGTADAQLLAKFIKDYKASTGIKRYTLRGAKSGRYDNPMDFDFSLPILVVEGIFLFDDPELYALMDKTIFVKCDIEAADERRRVREKLKWGDDYFPDTHPDSFSRLIKIGFVDYLNNDMPDNKADLRLTM